MIGTNVFFGASFDLVAVAAFLTVVGYSVNDTIVIYDRIIASFRFSIVAIKAPMQEIRYNIKSF